MENKIKDENTYFISQQFQQFRQTKKFIKQFYQILECELHQDQIQWINNGKAVLIKNQIEFEKKVLQQYYNASNIKSFFRQLSSYGFRVKGNKFKQKEIFHKYFIKNDQLSLSKIQRQQKNIQHEPLNSNDLSKLIKECSSTIRLQINSISQQQETILKQFRINVLIQSIITKNVEKIIIELDKQNQSEIVQTYQIFWNSMINIFIGFKSDIATLILQDLSEIGGPLSPIYSPLGFTYLS